MSLRFSLMVKTFLRDLRAGELNLLGLALVVALGALTSVGFLTDRVSRSLEQEANQLLGGDLLLVSDHPWDNRFEKTAQERGLRIAHTVLLNSMASAGTQALMVSAKAADSHYPLRGVLRTSSVPNAPETVAEKGPGAQEVWLDERAAAALQARVGDVIDLGYLHLKFTALLTFESDRGSNMFSLAPRVMFSLDQLPESGLTGPGARATWRLHLAGSEATVRAYETWAKGELGRGERIESVENARPEVRSMLDKAQRFLRLAALLAVILAAVAIGLAAQRFMSRHLDACAILRCLGAQQSELILIFTGEFVLFGAVCALAGAALGWALQWVLGQSAAELIGTALPAPSLRPIFHGGVVALTLLIGFVLPQLLRLAKVPTLRVLRREMMAVEAFSLTSWGVGALALVGIIFWIAQDSTLGTVASLGFAGALATFAGFAWIALQLLQRTRKHAGAGWRYGMAALARRRGSSILQITALGLGLTSLLLLTVIRADLIQSWEKNVPPDAPNRFIINIQPDQADGLRQFFQQKQLPTPIIQPMIRGRLAAINGQPVRAEDYAEERTRRLAEREFSLSYDTQLPTWNTITAGKWHGEDPQPQWSVEKGFAETFKLKLGDTVRFDIAGTPVEAPVTSFRALDWNSMRVNFFFIAPPNLLAAQSSSLITSFHLAPTASTFTPELIAAFPNLTIIDVTAMLAQLKGMIDKLILIVQVVFGFALLAGSVVLYAALQSTHDERQHELAILRTLGARNTQIRRALYTEFALLGGCAGLLAGIGASALGWGIATQALKIPYAPSLTVLALGMLIGAFGVVLAGAWGTRKLLTNTPLTSLRAL